MRPVEFVFEFATRYDVRQLERIDREVSTRVLSFPDGVAVDSQQELAEGPVLAVAPTEGEPWIGVFHGGGYAVPPAASRRVVGWPDEESICVVATGAGCLVHTEDPTRSIEIDAFPITDVLVVPDHELVVFSTFTYLVAYRSAGIAWRSGRLALDELAIVHAEDDVLHAAGAFGSVDRAEFTVDLRTGRPTGAPYEFDEDGGFGQESGAG